jgi:hypothetical protein
MKTTNYEISKQLAEAGFKAETDFYWAKWNEGDPELVHAKDGTPPLIEKVPAYDFETILEALPKTIIFKTIEKIYELRVWFNSDENQIGYQNFQGFHSELCFEQQENESLADVAARLWLELKQMGLV